jgi:hypothetical protein
MPDVGLHLPIAMQKMTLVGAQLEKKRKLIMSVYHGADWLPAVAIHCKGSYCLRGGARALSRAGTLAHASDKPATILNTIS